MESTRLQRMEEGYREGRDRNETEIMSRVVKKYISIHGFSQ